MRNYTNRKNEKNVIGADVVEIVKQGGATLNKDGEAVNFRDGFQVSKKDCYTINAESLNEIKKAVKTVLKRIGHESGLFCGIWVDSGLVYIDISERIKSRKKAVNVGKARHQISVHDWRAGDCVYC